MRGRFAAVSVAALACHPMLGLDAPPVGAGKTLLLVRARDGAVIGVDAVAAGSPLPSFGRVGDLDLAALELACPPSVLGLPEGRVELLETPLDAPRLPAPRSIFVAQIRGDEGSAWSAPAARPAWVEDALRRIDGAPDLACRARGFTFTDRTIDVPYATGVIPLPEGGALVLSTEGFSRLDAAGRLTPAGLSVETSSPSITLSGVLAADGTLYVLGSDGTLWRSTLAPGVMTPISHAPVGSLFELAGTPPTLYASSGTFGFSFRQEEEALNILRYDVASNAWLTLFSVPDPPGVGSMAMLPRDRSLLVAGASAYLDRGGRVRGLGALGELSVTSGTVTLTLVEVTPPGSSPTHQATTSIAQTRMLGVTVAAIECEENSSGMGCSDRSTMRATRSRLLHEVDGKWQFVDSFVSDGLAVHVADAGPDAVWIGSFRDQRYDGPMRALLDDGTMCPLYASRQASTRVYPLADDAFVAVNPRAYEPREARLIVYQRVPAPVECE